MRLGLRACVCRNAVVRRVNVSVAVLAFGECLEIGEQCDGGVVLGWFPGGDHRVDARPRGVFLAGQVVESSFAGQGARLLPACLVFGALGGQPTLAVGSSACRVVEQVGHGPAGWDGDGRGGVAAEAAQHLHPHPRGLTLDDPSQEPVLLGNRQACHPGGEFAGIVGDRPRAVGLSGPRPRAGRRRGGGSRPAPAVPR